MPDVITPNLSLIKIGIDESENTWGNKLNGNTDILDTFAGSTTTSLAGKVAKAGDTMTGALTLPGAPTLALHAATKGYVDAVSTAVDGKVAKAGDTMTGALALPDGSAGAPALRFSDDTNTGVFSPSNDVIALATGGTERLRVSSGGGVFIGTTATAPNPGIHLSPAGSQNIGNSNGSTGDTFLSFHRNSTLIGSVTQNGTSGVNFNTTSDYRLKDAIAPGNAAHAAETIQSILVRQFTWKAAPGEGAQIGFFAHELAALVPEAVTGVKDATNEDGSIKPQSVDYSRLVPRLVLALQHAFAEIDALKARVEVLETP